MSALDEQTFAAELRAAWFARREVKLDMCERSAVPMIVGHVEYVSPTDANAMVNGWMVTVGDVVAIGEPTHADHDAYAHRMLVMRRVASCDFCQGTGTVVNARSWISADAPATAACPRCGGLEA